MRKKWNNKERMEQRGKKLAIRKQMTKEWNNAERKELRTERNTQERMEQ
jgi:hypothetical protein